MGPYWVEPWTPGTLTVHYNLKRENKGKKRALFLYLRGINIEAILILFLHDFPPVRLLSGNVFGLVDDCRHMLMEAEPLENCCDERKP